MILTGVGQELAIGRKVDTQNALGVAVQRVQSVARMGIPQPDALVIAAAGNERAIGANRDTIDAIQMPLQDMPHLPMPVRANLPQPHSLITRPADQDFIVGAEGDCGDLVGVAAQDWSQGRIFTEIDGRCREGQPRHCPEAHLVVITSTRQPLTVWAKSK